MMCYIFIRNGAAVCSRDTQEEALDYAKKSMGWDIHQGRYDYKDAFGESHSSTYKVEEHEGIVGRGYRRTMNDVVLTKDQAIMPFPGTREDPSGQGKTRSSPKNKRQAA